jgi:hypothetical protein
MPAVVLPLAICYNGTPLAVAVAAYSPTGCWPMRRHAPEWQFCRVAVSDRGRQKHQAPVRSAGDAFGVEAVGFKGIQSRSAEEFGSAAPRGWTGCRGTHHGPFG